MKHPGGSTPWSAYLAAEAAHGRALQHVTRRCIGGWEKTTLRAILSSTRAVRDEAYAQLTEKEKARVFGYLTKRLEG